MQKKVGSHVATIYRELSNGYTMTVDEYGQRVYSAEIAQRTFERNIKRRGDRTGISFEVIHNHTTVDAPETVRFVREEFRRLEERGVKCTVNLPVYEGQRVTTWSLIPQMLMPPTRTSRYCCSVSKDHGERRRFNTTGVRWVESVKQTCNPIIGWRDRGIHMSRAYSDKSAL